jgi:2-polyprenyl-3-methyl-5-hydroxy-6-metoxy-1,4-benzoquinol methylase
VTIDGAVKRDCIVCGGRSEPSKLPEMVRCTRCGLVSADMDISDAELADLYGSDYFHGSEYLDYIAEQESLRLNFQNRIKTLRQTVPDLGARDLFEIGCAYGFFLDEVRSSVRSASGIDISHDAIRYARDVLGVAAQQGNYLAFDAPAKFGAIVMWDTIEHLKRPDLFLEKAARDLLPQGILALTTGDIGSLNARLRGREWRLIHPPTHLYYFSVKTMMALLHRCGFDVVHVSHPGNARNLRAVLHHILVIRMKRRGWYEIVKPWRLLDLRLTINLRDIMFVIARRR